MVAWQQLLRSASGAAHPDRQKLFPAFGAAFYGAGTALVTIAAGLVLYTPEAPALPSYARQTDQPCATCHTAFPELTPYGRAFKLGGYTAGGTRCGDGSARSDETQVPLAVMTEPVTNTNVRSKLAQPDNNNFTTVQQTSLFVGGQIYCDLGAFVQMTYDRPGVTFSWDNTDIRYSRTGTINGTDIVYGITANNNPTVQDVWNTIPAWAFPYISSEIAPTPAASTMLQGTWAGRVGGTGAYVWINNMVYVEFTAYGALDPRTLTTLGVDPTGGPRFDGAAPYWRLAIEKTWDKNSLMVGTFGMFANVTPVGNSPSGNLSALSFPGFRDPFTDIGVDAQYQYIGDTHIFTVRASYIMERQKLNGEFANGFSSNLVDTLNAFNASASYIYDRTISFTTGYFSISGSTDPLLYSTSTTGSPNSAGWVFDLAYLPFSKGGPDLWPWFNGRIGVTYTHYDKFDGSTNNVDMIPGLKASGNDTLFLYTWFAF
jgi:hypothetical protein